MKVTKSRMAYYNWRRACSGCAKAFLVSCAWHFCLHVASKAWMRFMVSYTMVWFENRNRALTAFISLSSPPVVEGVVIQEDAGMPTIAVHAGCCLTSRCVTGAQVRHTDAHVFAEGPRE